jgi:glutathione S-transferase
MLTLHQAEWCPHSRKVRQRLTELGVEFRAKQVPAEPDDRGGMRNQVGTEEIPVLVTGEGDTIEGDERIVAWLNERFEARSAASEHREKLLEKTGVPKN